ncbi:MAG: CRISPR-associated endonuclease Cas4g/Cas1g [Deferrisomatales bacterium]
MTWTDTDPIPARMLNEYAYCPRLGYLMWVEGLFADSGDTVHGRHVHRRVDQAPKRPRRKAAGDEAEPQAGHHRSVLLTGEACGLTAKIDLVEAEGDRATPVDYKRGKRPHTAKGAWEPERVQLCAQGLILRDNGFACEGGVIYFAGSRERVPVEFDDELAARTLELAAAFRAAAREGEIPPPLADSPKCPRCSLVAICLPDETLGLASGREQPSPRLLFPARDDALPLYVTEPRARMGKEGERLVVKLDDQVAAEARLAETSSVALFGSPQVSTQAVQALCQAGIPLTYLSAGGWFYGLTHGLPAKNVDLRRRQFRAADDPRFCLGLSRRFVAAKIANQRTLLRRNHPAAPESALNGMRSDAEQALRATRADELLGLEGVAARRYFEAFGGMLKADAGLAPAFTFDGRNRRPPRDPVNALLSFGYALLTREWTVALHTVGFDPYLGFFHQPRHGKPALALDLMEEFRPLVVDSAVLMAVNNGEVKPHHFAQALGSVVMTPEGRRAFLDAFERRLAQEVTHPVFGYRVSYRRVFEVQARLLGRLVTGEIAEYPSFTTR